LSDLFGDQEGIVYAPTKQGQHFKQHFFEWPQEREKLERHIDDYTNRDVYISPALFTERRISIDTFKGTRYLWSEFDRTIPTDAIQPSIRIASSIEGHEHWYWRLDNFVDNVHVVQDMNRRIAYKYGADLSVWDYQNVLRPPDTWNHKRNKPVTVLTKVDTSYSIDTFSKLPIPPVAASIAVDVADLPSKEVIIAKYRWQPDAVDLLTKTHVGKGSRSDALSRLAHEAVEAGCSNEEIYVLLEDRDTVWAKFIGRTDREKQLVNIISSVRTKHALKAEILQDAPEVYRFYDFMQTEIKLKWAIEGLLPVAGSMVILGAPGVGKSTFSLRMAIDIALGRDKFLIWPIVAPQRVLFISLEMQHYELKEFFHDMDLPIDEQQRLQDQFYLWPIGSAYPFDTPDQQSELLKYIKLFQIDIIIIDSHSLAMYGSISDDNDIKRLNSFLNEDVRKNNKCSYIFIHHPRKQSSLNTKAEIDKDDSYGSTFIIGNAQTVITVVPKKNSSRAIIRTLKNRMAKEDDDFYVERTLNRGFELITKNNAHPPEKREDSEFERDTNQALGKLFGL
jgi:archaellum biogenesis ATPase FlaH